MKKNNTISPVIGGINDLPQEITPLSLTFYVSVVIYIESGLWIPMHIQCTRISAVNTNDIKPEKIDNIMPYNVIFHHYFFKNSDISLGLPTIKYLSSKCRESIHFRVPVM